MALSSWVCWSSQEPTLQHYSSRHGDDETDEEQELPKQEEEELEYEESNEEPREQQANKQPK
jgi:hypothetical protein